MASHFITKAKLKSGELRYRAVITESGRNIKSKTFRRRADAKTWAIRFILEQEKLEATGEKLCNVTFSKLCHEYLTCWKGKNHDRPRMVLVWEKILSDTLLSDITPDLLRKRLKQWKDQAPATYNQHRSLLAALFKFAIQCHQDDENLRVYVSKNPVDEVLALKVDNKRIRYLEKHRLTETLNLFHWLKRKR